MASENKHSIIQLVRVSEKSEKARIWENMYLWQKLSDFDNTKNSTSQLGTRTIENDAVLTEIFKFFKSGKGRKKQSRDVNFPSRKFLKKMAVGFFFSGRAGAASQVIANE